MVNHGGVKMTFQKKPLLNRDLNVLRFLGLHLLFPPEHGLRPPLSAILTLAWDLKLFNIDKNDEF